MTQHKGQAEGKNAYHYNAANKSPRRAPQGPLLGSGVYHCRSLKTLKGLTPYEYICKCWTSQPERFKLNPLQQMPGLNT
jgi:hypothetical protein